MDTGASRFRAYSHSVKGGVLQSDLLAATEFVDTQGNATEVAVTRQPDDAGAVVNVIMSTAQLEQSMSKTQQTTRNPMDQAAWLLRSDIATSAAQLKAVTSNKSASLYNWEELEWVSDAGLVAEPTVAASGAGNATVDPLVQRAVASAMSAQTGVTPATGAVSVNTDAAAAVGPELLSVEAARSAANEYVSKSVTWSTCETHDVFADNSVKASSSSSLKSDGGTDTQASPVGRSDSATYSTKGVAGVRIETRCGANSAALWRFQESPLAPGSVRLQDVEFELLILPNGDLVSRCVVGMIALQFDRVRVVGWCCCCVQSGPKVPPT